MGRTVVITGCSSGFGRQLAEKLARRGDRVYATMRGVDGKNASIAADLRKLAKAESIDLNVVDLDVCSTESVERAVTEILADSGPPDVVVNNAGQMFVGISEAFTAEELATQLDINVVGIHRVTRAFLPAMRERGQGLFINLSSIAGRIAIPFFAIYHASKWAVEGYSFGLRRELASLGVDVVVVEPGPFATELFPRSPKPADNERAATYPEAVHATFAAMAQSFENAFADPDTPTDPVLVVDRMVELIEMKAGSRPFRTVVGVDFGTTAINEAANPAEDAVPGLLGLTEFTTLGKL